MTDSRFFKVTNDKKVSIVRVDDTIVEKKSRKWFGNKTEYEVHRTQEVVASRDATDYERYQPKLYRDTIGRKINCEEIEPERVIQRKF